MTEPKEARPKCAIHGRKFCTCPRRPKPILSAEQVMDWQMRQAKRRDPDTKEAIYGRLAESIRLAGKYLEAPFWQTEMVLSDLRKLAGMERHHRGCMTAVREKTGEFLYQWCDPGCPRADCIKAVEGKNDQDRN